MSFTHTSGPSEEYERGRRDQLAADRPWMQHTLACLLDKATKDASGEIWECSPAPICGLMAHQRARLTRAGGQE